MLAHDDALQVPRDFTGVAVQTVEYDGEVIDLIGAKLDNYYHWMAEGLTRLLLSYQHFVLGGAAPHARVILPPKVRRSRSVPDDALMPA